MKTYKTPIGALASAIVTTQALTKASKEWGGHSEEFERGFCLALDIVKKSIEDSICPDDAEYVAKLIVRHYAQLNEISANPKRLAS